MATTSSRAWCSTARRARRSGPNPPWSRWSTIAGAARSRSGRLGRYHYTIIGWVNRFKTWARDLGKRVEAGQEVSIQMLIGADLIIAAAGHAGGD